MASGGNNGANDDDDADDYDDDYDDAEFECDTSAVIYNQYIKLFHIY